MLNFEQYKTHHLTSKFSYDVSPFKIFALVIFHCSTNIYYVQNIFDVINLKSLHQKFFFTIFCKMFLARASCDFDVPSEI